MIGSSRLALQKVTSMKTSLSFLTILCLIGAATVTHAQDSNTPRSRSGVQRTSTAQPQDKPQSIAFRLTEWKTLHFDNANEAQQQVSTLKQLGCEAQADQHAGHVDVKFRAAKWTKVTLDTHELADQWEKWLKTTGFETMHGHDEAPTQGAIAVHYRMPHGNRMHVNDPEQAKEFVAIFTGLGCTVEQEQHGGHIDIAFSSPNWHNLIFETHDEAHAIQKWLDEQGFETQHNH